MPLLTRQRAASRSQPTYPPAPFETAILSRDVVARIELDESFWKQFTH